MASFTLFVDVADQHLIRTHRQPGPKGHGIDTHKNNNHLTINVILLTFIKNGGITMSKKSTTLLLPVELTEVERIEINAKLARELLLKKALNAEIAGCKDAIKTHDGNIELSLRIMQSLAM